MFSLGYKPLINKPTRTTTYSSTLIDNIFTNDLDYSLLRSYKRNMLNEDKFIEEGKNTDWDFITNSIDVNSSYNIFY